jgi:hypothetical protein
MEWFSWTDACHCTPDAVVLLCAGKTLLARAVAAESGASFFSITGGSILSMWVLRMLAGVALSCNMLQVSTELELHMGHDD